MGWDKDFGKDAAEILAQGLVDAAREFCRPAAAREMGLPSAWGQSLMQR